jgi:hypothetical protein
MAKKYPKSETQNDQSFANQEAYVTWDDNNLDSKKQALRESSESLSEYTGVQKTSASSRYRGTFINLSPYVSGRPGLARSDYDYFRPDEAIPTHVKEIIKKAEEIYQRVGLVKNVIDLMGDFACQGIKLVHKNKRIERFYRHWFKKINGKDRSERFLNNLYKTGNIVIHRQTGKLSLKVTDKLYQSVASPDLQITELDSIQLEKREIPWKYTFIDPVLVNAAGGALSSFVQDKKYELILPAHLRKIISAPKTQAEKDVIAQLPEQIIEAASSKKAYPLDPSKTIVFHYKKDDWQTWAYPMIHAIMDDIIVIEKLKLADMAALDGAISNIRIFKLGSLEHKIAPTKAATSKLAQILENNVGGGTMDLVWGPDIELLESNTNVHNFLGESKYIPHLNAVYAGLGIPPTLTGTYGAAGTTNNFISLKTLTQRLQYGRDILMQFWEKEIVLVQKAMGFRYPAKIEFDRMDLSNEDAEKALLVQLADRNLISDELLQSRFGFDPDIEKNRLNREKRERDSSRMIKKAGPWHDPQLDNALKKIALQSGIVSPSQVGLNLDKKKSGEKSAMDLKNENIKNKGFGPAVPSPTSIEKNDIGGVPGQGRPKLSKDQQQRQTKKFAPQTGASLLIWAIDAQEKISSIINPTLLEFYKKKNLRSLSKDQTEELESVKTKILMSLEPFKEITNEYVLANMSAIDSINNNKIIGQYLHWLNNIKYQLNRDLSTEEIKQARASFYTSVYTQ